MHEEIINKVMGKLLEGDNPLIEKLRAQFKNSKIDEVRDTKVGMYVKFSISDKSTQINGDIYKLKFAFGDVVGIIDNKISVGFVLYVNNGYLEWLEGYSLIDDIWQLVDDCNEFTFTGGRRDLNELEKNWLL